MKFYTAFTVTFIHNDELNMHSSFCNTAHNFPRIKIICTLKYRQISIIINRNKFLIQHEY